MVIRNDFFLKYFSWPESKILDLCSYVCNWPTAHFLYCVSSTCGSVWELKILSNQSGGSA